MNKVLISAIAIVKAKGGITMGLKRLYTTGTIIVICVIIATIQAASAVPTMGVEPSYISVSQGDTFTVNITIDPNDDKISGADYILCFDNTLLNATSLTKGAFFSGFSTTTYGEGINNTIGIIDYGEAITGGNVTTPGTLTTITFEAIGPGSSNLNFSVVTVINDTGAADVGITNGTVEIVQPSTPFLIYGYVSYKGGSECNNPVVNITNLNTSMEWAAETNECTNHYQLVLASCTDIIAGETLQFNVISPDGSQWNATERIVNPAEVDAGGFEYNITLEFRPGDVNGNGEITSADAVIALQMAVCGEYNSVADVNHDDAVTSLDALMILQAAAEHIPFDG